MVADLGGQSVAVLPDHGRKLIAVVYADMCGYSRLIGLDDAGTFERLRELRRDLIDPALSRHGGTLVSTGGDSLLVRFDSIISAMRFAADMQRGVPDFDADYAPDRRVRFRMGVNVGDAIPDGTNLHGEGVNIAARLQAICPPGEICVSRVVRDQVGNRLGLSFKKLGSIDLKNISQPTEAFLLEVSRASATLGVASRTRRWRRTIAITAASLVCVAAAILVLFGAGWLHLRSDVPPSQTVRTQSPNINLPPLSIVVLPFENLSGNAGDDYLADGITDNLTSDLSTLPGMFVISRASAYTYKGKVGDPRQIGGDLGVRYLLEGSVRKMGDAVRVNAQLVAAGSGVQLWADRFDQKLSNLGSGQEEIVRRIGLTLTVALLDIESARSKRERPTDPGAFDLILRARSIGMHPMGPRENDQRLALFEQAPRLDPTSISAITGLAIALLDTGRKGDELSRAARQVRSTRLRAL
jgi:adenylate cyclase